MRSKDALREIIVSLYLLLFTFLFTMFSFFPLRRKATFVISFGENSLFVYEEMKRQHIDAEVVFLYKSTCPDPLKDDPRIKKYSFETLHVMDTLMSAYHIATSEYLFVDNYFGFLATIQFRKGVQCVQLWHAAGAIKKFGLLTPSFYKRSKQAQRRFLRVYNNFHKLVVGSDALADIYRNAFGLSEERMLKTGIPRTDVFFDQKQQQRTVQDLVKANPGLQHKKVILYAPTFREQELQHFTMELDIEEMYRKLKDEYCLLIKLHPAIRDKADYETQYKGFVYDYSFYPNINDLLLITDILITDYSSIPFEFCLLQKPMIFFSYDLEKYRSKPGIIGEYESTVPGPIVYHTSDIVTLIQNNAFDMERIQEFAFKWNQYSKGDASEKLVHALFKQ